MIKEQEEDSCLKKLRMKFPVYDLIWHILNDGLETLQDFLEAHKAAKKINGSLKLLVFCLLKVKVT